MHVNILFPINAEAFTYLVPEELESKIKTGMRVLAPFKRGKKIGIVQTIDHRPQTTEYITQTIPPNPPIPPFEKGGQGGILKGGRGDFKKVILKPIESVLDEEPLIPENLLKLIKWTGQYYISTSGLALKNAVPAGIIEGRKSGKSRITYDNVIEPAKIFDLTSEQKNALTEIAKTPSGVFLLHGVTGSGKTEVYIQAIKSLPQGTGAIVLVPEIAITAQMIDRFRSHFGDKVVFFHSGISMGEKITQWRKMRNNEARVVLGVRSAVFAPFEKLGLIVIDEEQEASYKQFEGLRYSARDVAFARAQLVGDSTLREGIKIILGSATPSIEAFYNAGSGKFKYIELKHRINQKPLPRVHIIDMTKEDKKTWSFSDKLLDALKENISKGFQSLIMLNRRGYSPFLLCTDCGYTQKCPACSITLTYHKDTKTLNCHYCGSYLEPKDLCPGCGGTRTKHIGVGTQRVEEELRALIPELSLKRMDRDTTRKKLSHYRIVKDMEAGKIDVLLGTQMVAKGHDFPHVTLSAIVSSDIALNLPDFRSAERAFQLFTQLAGRAGRGDVSGEVYIQTYQPEHYVFEYVRNHDYKRFYQQEIELRKELRYPPYSRLIRIILNFKTREIAKNIIKDLAVKIKKLQFQGVEVLGPAPAPVEKIRNLWRWHLILKGNNFKSLRQSALHILKQAGDVKDVKVDVDVDPINML
ncbi:MAG: primosomal protein N' [Nitrospirota bacterium]